MITRIITNNINKLKTIKFNRSLSTINSNKDEDKNNDDSDSDSDDDFFPPMMMMFIGVIPNGQL